MQTWGSNLAATGITISKVLLVPLLLGVIALLVILDHVAQQRNNDLETRIEALQAQIDTKAPYPVALAERVLTLQAEVDQLKGTAKQVESLNTRLDELSGRENRLEQQFVDRIFDQDPLIRLRNAKLLLDSGNTEAARALTVGAVADLVGRKNLSCRSTPTTDQFLISYIMPRENLNKMLQGSAYSIDQVGKNSYGAETVSFRVDGYINGC